MHYPSPYDAIARLYDPWSRSVTEDVQFYVEHALAAGGPVVELGVGTGRIAIPIAKAGVPVIGVDTSAGMLQVAAEEARKAGVAGLLDLRQGDLRDPPVSERVPLVTCPFRAFLHLDTEADRLTALHAARDLLLPGGLFVFDVFAPSAEDIAETHGQWLEREPGIWERAVWDEDARTLTLTVRGPSGESTMQLAWLSTIEWRDLLERAGFTVMALYGWFDRRPWAGGEDAIWIVQPAADRVGP
jgi:SAM-dependent methyltransferase